MMKSVEKDRRQGADLQEGVNDREGSGRYLAVFARHADGAHDWLVDDTTFSMTVRHAIR
jgi:hypothetical protein